MTSALALRRRAMGKGAFLSDSFNRADTALELGTADTGQSWVLAGPGGGTGTVGWRITSNAAVDPEAGNEHFATCDAQANGTFSAVMKALPASGTDGGLVVRMGGSTSTDCILLNVEVGAPGYSLYRRVAGNYTKIATVSTTAPAAQDTLKIVASGSSLTASVGAASAAVTETAGQSNTWAGFRSSGAPAHTLSFDSITGEA